MRNTRPLWTSVIFVGLLIAGSLTGFFTGTLKPTLGLDLQGGLSVILAAPGGTPRAVMQQALENIRHRVDAFGVGEPQIFLSGNNIEVQLPGLAPGKVVPSAKSQYCIVGSDGTSYGCATSQADAQKALGEIAVSSVPTNVCVVDASGNTLDAKNLCFPTQSQAQSASAAITVSAKSSPTSTASPSPSPPPATGPSPAASQYCLTASSGTQYTCFKTQAAASTAQKGLTTKVTGQVYCLSAPSTVAVSPSPSAGKAKKTPTPSPSPTPATQPSASSSLSNADHPAALPCTLKTKDGATSTLSALKVAHDSQHFCVISSAGKNLGCFLSQQAAVDQQKATGQQHLLQVIGETARLEERPVLAILPPTAPTPITCSTADTTTPPSVCSSFTALGKRQIVVLNTDASVASVGKYQLGPVVISGSDITKATAILQQATQTNLSSGWAVQFQLSGSGSKAFAAATTAAVPKTSPQNQIAIVVDKKIISSPYVQSAITGGLGVISGGRFTEQTAKDLATQLNAGALPVELTRQSVQTVSPTLGKESLRQGIVAGVAGLTALFLYLLFYYRLLGVVAWLGMSIWAVLAFALVSLAGKTFGYSLSLAGVAGLAISLGVTADSYIVFFERLKDEVRNGKTPRSAVVPAFKRAYRTIVAADSVTGIAALVLYITAVSSVKGFALTLGVATLLDLFVVYFFKRPTVFLIARNERLVNLRGFGLTSGVAADAEPAIAGGSE